MYPLLRVLSDNKRIGYCVSDCGSIPEILSNLPGIYTCQFCLGSLQSYSCRTVTPSERAKTLSICERDNKTFYVHCSLKSNLARNPSDYIAKSSRDCAQKVLNGITGLPGAGIIHIGNSLKLPESAAISNTVSNISMMNISRGTSPRVPYSLLLENASHAGTEIGWSMNHLRVLFERIDNPVGICIDTQHSFAAGLCRFQCHEDIVRLFDDVEEFHPSGIQCFHLNDSEVAFGSKRDRHESIGNGYIWSDDTFRTGLEYLIKRCFEHSIDMILETPNQISDLEWLKSRYY